MSSRFRRYLHDARTLPGDCATAWRQEGLPGAWKQISQRTLHRLYRRGRLLVVRQELARVRECAPPPGIEIRPLREHEWPAFRALTTQRRWERFRIALESGRTCLVAWRGPEPVGYTWISATISPEIEMHPLPLPPDGAYLWDLYVLPAERNGGVGSALVSARLAYARARGFRTGWRLISPRNRPSLRTLEKTSGSGTRIVGELSYHKLLSHVRAKVRTRPEGESSDAGPAPLRGATPAPGGEPLRDSPVPPEA
ncbi:MAG: N-acetyltransferase family protein [Gemmatimonadota bacterium]